MSLVTAKSVVLDIMRKARMPEEEYFRTWGMVVDVYRDMHLNHVDSVKVSKAAMNNNRIIFYPSDMIELVGCYVPYHGEMVALSPKKLVPTYSRRLGANVLNLEDGEGEPVRVGGRGYKAEPHNEFGYYYNYTHERYIRFETDYRSEVMLAYKTSGLSEDDTLIPVQYKNALFWGVVQMDTLLSRNPQWRAQEVGRKYEDELSKLRMQHFDHHMLVEAWIRSATPTR